MFVLARFLVFFYIGVIATLAWQSYGGGFREAISSRSPRLAWLASSAAPDGDQIGAISRDLAVVRRSVDELAANVSKLQTLQQSGGGRTSASQSSPAVVPVRKRGADR
jgi:hypothetical protein